MKTDDKLISESNGTISIINIDKLCRVCLTERESLNGIFESNVVDMIRLCANVEVKIQQYQVIFK